MSMGGLISSSVFFYFLLQCLKVFTIGVFYLIESSLFLFLWLLLLRYHKQDTPPPISILVNLLSLYRKADFFFCMLILYLIILLKVFVRSQELSGSFQRLLIKPCHLSVVIIWFFPFPIVYPFYFSLFLSLEGNLCIVYWI